MPSSRTVPPPRRKARMTSALVVVIAAAIGAVVAAYFAGKRVGAVQELLAASPANASGIGLVRKQPCATGWCETLWLGKTRSDAIRVAELPAGAEHCDEIAWAADGYRVGFVINGYQ